MTPVLRRLRLNSLFFVALLGALGCVCAPNACASEGFLELVRLTQAGADADDMIAYVQRSPGRFDLTERERMALLDLGADEKVFAVIEERNRALSAGPEPLYVVPEAAPGDELRWDAEADLPEGDAVDQDVFYRTLSPYGTWLEADGQWVWRPTAALVDAHWRPYCHRGRWAVTEHGWTWCSDYSWGWAPFHYGRWHRHQVHGWVWTPGLEWGPGWVVWRPGQTDCGWAPMPPAAVFRPGVGVVYIGQDADWGLVASSFVFVAIARLFEPHWWDYRHHRDTRNELYGRLPLAHTHVEIVNNICINRGLEINVVERVIGRPVQRFEIARPVIRPGEHFRPQHFEGQKLFVYRPAVRPTVAILPAAIQQAREDRIKHYEVAHDQRFGKMQMDLRVAANQRNAVLAAELEQVAERRKQHEAEAETRRLRDQKLSHETELKRIGAVRAENEDRAQRAVIQKAEEEQKRRFEEAKVREAQAAREAEMRRKEAENAEKARATKAIVDQRRAQDEQRRAQEAELAAQKERAKQLDEQRKHAAEAQQRAALEKQQADLRKQLDAQRAAQAEAQRRADESRKALEAGAKTRVDQARRTDEQRIQQEKALEDARREAASRAADRQRQAIRDEKSTPPVKPTPPARDDKATPPGKDDKTTPPGKDDKATPPGKDDKTTPPGRRGR